MGLAWLLISSRSTPSYEERTRAPMNWPITFRLPTGYAWSPEDDFQSRNTAINGDFGSLRFHGNGGERGGAEMIVAFDTTAGDTAFPEDIDGVVDVTGIVAVTDREIRIGPVSADVTPISVVNGRWDGLVATARLPAGLIIRVGLFCTAGEEETWRALEEVCESITFVPWWIEV